MARRPIRGEGDCALAAEIRLNWRRVDEDIKAHTPFREADGPQRTRHNLGGGFRVQHGGSAPRDEICQALRDRREDRFSYHTQHVRTGDRRLPMSLTCGSPGIGCGAYEVRESAGRSRPRRTPRRLWLPRNDVGAAVQIRFLNQMRFSGDRDPHDSHGSKKIVVKGCIRQCCPPNPRARALCPQRTVCSVLHT